MPDNDAINPDYATHNPNWRSAMFDPLTQALKPQAHKHPDTLHAMPLPEFKSNSREVLELVAEQLDSMLEHTLGPDTMYVLVLRNGLPTDLKCNVISNAPIDRASELKDIFAELSTRQIQTAN